MLARAKLEHPVHMANINTDLPHQMQYWQTVKERSSATNNESISSNKLIVTRKQRKARRAYFNEIKPTNPCHGCEECGHTRKWCPKRLKWLSTEERWLLQSVYSRDCDTMLETASESYPDRDNSISLMANETTCSSLNGMQIQLRRDTWHEVKKFLDVFKVEFRNLDFFGLPANLFP